MSQMLKTRHSNTTLVKVKFYTLDNVIVKWSDSNTTLVKVKFSKVCPTSLLGSDSNTTLVKVKFTARMISLVVSAIQIQHLLKLNSFW